MADISAAYTGGQEQNAPSHEKRLLDVLDRMRNNLAGTFAVHLHLSALRPSHRQPHFLRMVSRSLDSLASNQDVQIFNFSNLDVVLLCRNTPVDDVDDAVFRVRAMFNEDPLTMSEDGSAEDRFSTWYDVTQPGDLKDFTETVVEAMEHITEVAEQQGEAMTTGRASKAMQGEPLLPDKLQQIAQKLLEVRIGDLVHRQPAVMVSGGKKQKLAFREHYIAMEELRQRIAPDINIFSSHWLFQYLSESIDARVLEVLSRLDFANMDVPVSVNLNISTVMTRPFQNFHALIGDHTDKVVVEIQIIDVFADMGAYTEVRDWLQDQGYKVMIDGLNPLTLHFFDPSLLDADMIKVTWGPEVRGGISHDQTEQIRNVVSNMPAGGVVLSRVDSEEGVSWGLGLGIRCYQGHFIDKVVDAMVSKGMIGWD
ncbi:MAG: EAL domain-containing protein [Magnetovibrio sp.]|nr:EAL domain-containing protein [Magnetovibrio sp.]